MIIGSEVTKTYTGEWYWQKIDSKSLKEIAIDWANSHIKDNNIIYLDVLKGIQAYTKLLAS